MNPRYFNPTFGMNKKPQTKTNDNLRREIIMFFRKNPYPSDQQVHNFAKKLGINKHKFEEIIYSMLTELLQKQ